MEGGLPATNHGTALSNAIKGTRVVYKAGPVKPKTSNGGLFQRPMEAKVRQFNDKWAPAGLLPKKRAAILI